MNGNEVQNPIMEEPSPSQSPGQQCWWESEWFKTWLQLVRRRED